MDRNAIGIETIIKHCPNVLHHETQTGIYTFSLLEDLKVIFECIKLHNYKQFLDLGSGDGRAVFLASQYTIATGIENDEKLFTKSKKVQTVLNMPCTFYNQDYQDIDFSHYDCLFIYPDAPFYRGLQKKLEQEFKGVLIVYSSIFLPSWKPILNIPLNGMTAHIYAISSPGPAHI